MSNGRRPAGRLPLLAIVGRPNVGKSTLFNRLVGRRQAIVDNQPGVTRDRQYAVAEWEGVPFRVVDTGGFDLFTEDAMAVKVRDQAAAALAEADVALFVADAVEGLTPLDEELARTVLARFPGKVFVLANKVDHPGREPLALEFYRLGVEKVYPVSAEHALGLDAVMAEVLKALPASAGQPEAGAEAIRVALVGRPNVGKSSLVNALLGEERVVVDATPGTTRDAVDTPFARGDERWVLVDTAGIRRRGRIAGELEKYSVLRSSRAIERADVCVLVLDAGELVTDQDAHIAGAIVEAKKACVIAVNKWDLVDIGPKAGDEYRREIAGRLKHLAWAPVLLVSAKSGRSVGKLLDAARTAYGSYSLRIPTPELNAFFRRAVRDYKPPTLKGRKISLGYIAQEGTRPPAFTVLVNEASRVHFTYRRYLENRLREEFSLGGTAIVLHFRSKAGSFAAAQARLKPDRRGTLDRKFSGAKPDRRFLRPKPGAGRAGKGKPGPGGSKRKPPTR
ncbi:MAG TPA: ribosome biogenesis GTPase Der [Candidatus Methanoperedens sp.]|nr:ribosome biogenesis GTPase Der [Candidatus Methanoperedens sp.]